MNAKKWLLSLLFFIILFMVVIETKYQLFRTDRHEVDYLVNTYLPKIKNKTYQTIIIGDSLARNAFSGILLKKDILDLTSNQAISMAGNYFLLKRYLKNNQNPKNIYLFCIPGFLHNNLDQIWTYSYFESVFLNTSEVNEIKKIKPNLYSNNFDRYLESRKKSITLFSYKPINRVALKSVDEKTLKVVPKYMNNKIKNHIKNMTKIKYIIEDIPRVYLDKIIDLCKENNINFTIVIEPMPIEYNNIFKKSAWNSYLKNKKINYLNINDYYTFSTYFFRNDGTHIHGKVNQFYQNIINEKILHFSR